MPRWRNLIRSEPRGGGEAAKATRRLLPEGRLAGPMPWVLAIMTFLTVLATAAGGTILAGQARLGAAIARDVTVQILAADESARRIETDRAAARLENLQGVQSVRVAPPAEVEALVAPWLGSQAGSAGLPLPGLIDVTLDRAADAAAIETLGVELAIVAPSARVEAQAGWLAPVTQFARSLALLAAGLVLLLATALVAVVVLAVRASFDANRATIEIMHHLGATDTQVARLFQRRLAADALFGGLVGLGAAALVLLLLARQAAEVQSQLLAGSRLGMTGWLTLVLVPLAVTAIAGLVARATVLRALGRLL